jgi:hypothetical protein
MDMFLLFAVIFLSVMIAVGLGALALSLLFRLVLRLSRTPAGRGMTPAPAAPQAPPAL